MPLFFSDSRDPNDPLELFVACAPGLEPLCAVECEESGALGIEASAGGVRCAGTVATVARLNREVGSAIHVLVRLARFRSHHLRDFDRRVRGLDWSRLFEGSAPFTVRAVCKRSKLYHTGAVEERAAKAIADATSGQRVADGPEVSEPRLRIRIVDGECTLSLDVSGQPLYRRGFRLEVAKAPLREDLAWAMVRSSGYRPGEEVFVDPFCGSGSLPIHAALFACGLPPNGGRGFALERTRLVAAGGGDGVGTDEGFAAFGSAGDSERGDGLGDELDDGLGDGTDQVTIFGSDRDRGAVEAAQHNAERALVADRCRFEQLAFSDALAAVGSRCEARPPAAEDPGPNRIRRRVRIVTNPPFGGRVSGGDSLERLYSAFGDRVRGLDGAAGLILSADRRLTARTGLSLRSAFRVEAGGLPVTSLRFGRDEQ